jgi:hypothetical protein
MYQVIHLFDLHTSKARYELKVVRVEMGNIGHWG